jgi:Cyclin, N-terminal domain
MNLMDRFLLRTDDLDFSSTTTTTTTTPSSSTSRNYQLSAMTCLYLTLKLHTRHYKRHLRILAELSRGQFIVEDILEMESIVLETLDWRVHPPTPMTFVQYFLLYHQQQYCCINTDETLFECRTDMEELSSSSSSSSLPSSTCSPWSVVLEIARYCTECAVLECHHPPSWSASPSQLAYACTLAAMEVLTEDALSTTEREAFGHHMTAFVSPLEQSLAARLSHHLVKLISVPELLLLVSEHQQQQSDPSLVHPIAVAWQLAWLRCCHTNNNRNKSASRPLPLTPIRQESSDNHCCTAASPVSVL